MDAETGLHRVGLPSATASTSETIKTISPVKACGSQKKTNPELKHTYIFKVRKHHFIESIM